MNSILKLFFRIFAGLFAILVLMVGVFIVVFWRVFLPPQQTVENRLAAFPESIRGLQQAVEIRWNEHQVPYIFAESDRDLFLSLGMVQAHLRGSQVDFLLHLAEGRLGELFGHPVIEVDAFLRRLNFGKAVPGSLDLLPPETRELLEAFVEGFNAYRAERPNRAPDSRLLGLPERQLSVEDVLTISKLAGTDVNLLTSLGLLRAWNRPGWPEIFAKVQEQNRRNLASFEAPKGGLIRKGVPFSPTVQPTFRPPATPATNTRSGISSPRQSELLCQLLLSSARVGSNSIALSPSRTSFQAAAMVNDPHLGFNLPNFWLLVGLKSPSFDCVGMMPPGLPIVALGRNPNLAWGGTNMRAASSDLYDVSSLDPSTFEVREEILERRFWFPKNIRIRETSHGPIISDASLVPSPEDNPIALKWVGHLPSDEITPFLNAARAPDVLTFHAAFALSNYGVAGQNMLAADTLGNIGQVLALNLPLRPYRDLPDLVLNPLERLHQWAEFASGQELPFALNPVEGYIASANNRPASTTPPLGFLFGVDERIEVLKSNLRKSGILSPEDLRTLQLDTFSPDALKISRFFVAALRSDINLMILDQRLFAALEDWDGRYETDSTGALAFELFLNAFIESWQEMEPRSNPWLLSDWRYLSDFFVPEAQQIDPGIRYTIVRNAIERTSSSFRKYQTWGNIHRLRTGGLLQRLPAVGNWFVDRSDPIPGSRETVMKSAHGLVSGLHHPTYGSQSRHISHLDDPDHNWFVLLGGQDATRGSSTFNDQTALFLRGEMIRMPLRPESIREEYTISKMIRPAL
ncbi:MAG: penicillin acylase family protein [Puniceicoccaceae bacterium]